MQYFSLVTLNNVIMLNSHKVKSLSLYISTYQRFICSNVSKYGIINKSFYQNVNNFTALNTTFKNKLHVNVHQKYKYSIQVNNDPDVFGNYQPKRDKIDPGDLEEKTFLQEPPRRYHQLSTKQYADIIKDLIKQRRIKEAIEVLEERMVKKDKVQPENYIYNLLLGACGRIGYTKKAFMLFNDMKKRGLKPTGGTYTALFNACANSPWQSDGLSRAQKLKELMKEKMYEPNDTNYHVMIKAFGRCGDLETAFYLVDEMMYKRIKISNDTLNFLLQACISDKEAGFRHALLVWRKFIVFKIQPNIYTYNLILRSIRDCSIGNLDVTQNLISEMLNKKTNLLSESSGEKLLITFDKNNRLITETSLNVALLPKEEPNGLQLVPNLMAKDPHVGNMISVGEVTKAEDRLLLIGGLSGFLENMFHNKVVPDIKTFTLLIDVIPNSSSAEKELLRYVKKHNIVPDLDFYNMLIKKRSMRFDYTAAKEVIHLMEKMNYRPNLITYGLLALGCKNKEEALEFLNNMKKANYRINIEILGAMLFQACCQNNCLYVIELMDICQQENIKPNTKFMEHLSNFKRKLKNISGNHAHPSNKSFSQREFKLFRRKYEVWLSQVESDENVNVHPWQQFREKNYSLGNKYQDKQSKNRFKPRHTSKFVYKPFKSEINKKSK